MDDRRFDSLVRMLGAGGSRRSVLKGMAGLAGAALVGSAAVEDDTEAARRPTPTPTPVKCPGRQIPVNGVCTCPATALNKCGPDCCTSVAGGPPTPSHSECCDNACCVGTCYDEELCCPTNWRPNEQPPTHQVCTSANGVQCCPFEERCCEVDGCCDTVCWGGEDGISVCCPQDSFCRGSDPEGDTCCTNNSTCCGGGTSGNICLDLTQAGVCCSDEDCPEGQPCVDYECAPPPCSGTLNVFVLTHGALQTPGECPAPFQYVETEVGLYAYENGACSSTLIASTSTSGSSPATFDDLSPGSYCALPIDEALRSCLDCPDLGSGVGVNIGVACDVQTLATLGVASCCVTGETVSVLVQSGSGPSGCSEGTHLTGVPVALYDCDSGELIYGPVFTNNDGNADFTSVPLGTYCVGVPPDSAYSGCERCQDSPLYRSRIEVTCDQTNYPLIGICRQGETCVEGVCVPDDPCNNECDDVEVCVQGQCLCAPGYYTDFNQVSGCTACPEGTYSDVPGSIDCDNCDLNYYQPDSASTSCLPCPEGTYTEHVRSTICTECNCALGNMPLICGCTSFCPPGSAPDGFGMCAECDPGSASFDGNACIPCAAGSYADGYGATVCDQCSPGTYAFGQGAASCAECEPGSFATGPGAQGCEPCPVGTASNSYETVVCPPCDPGTYASVPGMENCQICDCGATCNPATGTCGSVGVGGPCSSNAECASDVCGCGSPPGLPECMCRFDTCFATGQDCSAAAGGFGAISCCEGDCTCFNGITDCVCTTPL